VDPGWVMVLGEEEKSIYNETKQELTDEQEEGRGSEMETVTPCGEAAVTLDCQSQGSQR
jgi:hypothetical protein